MANDDARAERFEGSLSLPTEPKKLEILTRKGSCPKKSGCLYEGTRPNCNNGDYDSCKDYFN